MRSYTVINQLVCARSLSAARLHPTRSSSRSLACRRWERRAARVRCCRFRRRRPSVRRPPSPLPACARSLDASVAYRVARSSLAWSASSHPTSSHPTLPRSMVRVGAVGARAKAIPGDFQSSRLPVRFFGFGAVCWMRLLDVCEPGQSPKLIRCGSGSRASGCRVFYQLVQRHLVV